MYYPDAVAEQAVEPGVYIVHSRARSGHLHDAVRELTTFLRFVILDCFLPCKSCLL